VSNIVMYGAVFSNSPRHYRQLSDILRRGTTASSRHTDRRHTGDVIDSHNTFSHHDHLLIYILELSVFSVAKFSS